MGVRFACHACGKRLNIKTELAGRRGICPACSVRFRIPVHDTETSTPVSTQDSFDESESSDSVFTAADQKASGRTDPIAAHQTGTATAAPNVSRMQTNRLPAHRSTNGRASSSATAAVHQTPSQQAPSQQTASHQPDTVAASLDEVLGGTHATWYVRPPSGGQYGPADGPTLGQWIQEGRVSETAMLWRDGWPDWKTAKQVLPIFERHSNASANHHVGQVASSVAAAYASDLAQPPAQAPAVSAHSFASTAFPAHSGVAPAESAAASQDPGLNLRSGGKILDTNKKKMSRKRVSLSIMLACIVVVLAVALVLVVANPR